MVFNSSSGLWEYNRSFDYKGTHSWKTECNISVDANESFVISDTPPTFVTWETTTLGQEDNNPSITYNFSANVTEPDVNDNLTFSFEEINSNKHSSTNASDYPWISLNSSTGIMTINATNDTEAAYYTISVNVIDTDSNGESRTFYFNITPVNDQPYFVDLSSLSADEDERKTQNITATDEENDVPYSFNISFVNCTKDMGGFATGSNCEFQDWNWTNGDNWIYLNFTPLNNETGDYILNFSVTDNRSASNWTLVNLNVRQANDRPNLSIFSNLTSTEDVLTIRVLNATDTDEYHNLTFSSNVSWFLSSITDDYNYTQDHANATINFTPTDIRVGNWSINISVTDTGNTSGGDVKSDWQVINFIIYNVNDTPALDPISNQQAYVGGSFSFDINAEDDDLLVPDASIFDENLTFSYTDVSGDLSLNIVKGTVSGNSTPATVYYSPTSGQIGNHTINITVTDISGNMASRIFNITVEDNNPPNWTTQDLSFDLTEDTAFSMNLTDYVTDIDGDDINFSASYSSFTSFSMNDDTGLISFTPTDADVGTHIVTFNATDGKGVYSLKNITFVVNYTLEAPILDNISDQNATEDQQFILYINATDGDLAIPDNVYDENLTWSDNTSLFNISELSVNGNVSTAIINFTPTKDDVGVYYINITVTDANGSTDSQVFMLNISEVNDPPYFLQNITDQEWWENQNTVLDINATDEETPNNLIYTSNISWINNSMNHTTGLINVTPNASEVGNYSVSITVSDGTNSTSMTFNLTVYEENVAPNITFPKGTNATYSMNETDSYDFWINANDSNSGPPNNDRLNYSWLLDGVLVYNVTNITTGYYNWTYTTDYEDETTGGDPHNLTAIVTDSQGLTDSFTWYITVNHTNAPPVFSGPILNQSSLASGSSIDLNDYFSDVDHDDPRYNQSIDFTWKQYDYESNWTSLDESNLTESSDIGVSISSSTYLMTFTTTSETTKLFKIIATDSDNSSMNATSNIFEVHILPPETVTKTTSGGGGGNTKITSLNILTPGPLTMYKNDTLVSNITIENEGFVDLSGITLSVNGSANLELSLSQTYISSLRKNEKKNITLTIRSFNKTGDEEVIVKAKVKSPSFSDSAKLFLTVLEKNKKVVKEKLEFTEELISDNPACLELKETVEEAKRVYEQGDYEKALKLADEAVRACRASVATSNTKEKRETPVLRPYFSKEFTMFLIVLILFIMIAYYAKRHFIKRSSKRKFKSEDEDIKIEVE